MSQDDVPDFIRELWGKADLGRFQVPEPLDIPDYEPVPQPTAEHAEQQIEQNRELLVLIGAMKQIAESQAADAKANAVREAEQQKFNQRMTWVAIILAAGALVVPFIERLLWP